MQRSVDQEHRIFLVNDKISYRLPSIRHAYSRDKARHAWKLRRIAKHRTSIIIAADPGIGWSMADKLHYPGSRTVVCELSGISKLHQTAYSFRKSKSQYLHIEDSLQSRRDCCFCWNPSKYWGHPSPIVNNELQFYRHGPGGFAYTSRSWVQLLYTVYKLPDSGWTVHDRRDCKLVYR